MEVIWYLGKNWGHLATYSRPRHECCMHLVVSAVYAVFQIFLGQISAGIKGAKLVLSIKIYTYILYENGVKSLLNTADNK